MPNSNETRLTGHLTRDPEIRFAQSGLAICTIGLAVNSRYKSGDEWKTEVCFVDGVAFGELAEEINDRFKIGNAFSCVGRLAFDQWEKDGQKRSKHKVVINEAFIPVYRKHEKGEKQYSKNRPTNQQQSFDDQPPLDEDIPF